MKILIITPMYSIEGRKNLFHDSSAIHYLIKYWPKECEILVIYTYFNSIKSIYRYINNKERKYHKNGYSYFVDGIKVEMIETQLLIHQSNLNNIQINRLKKEVNLILERNNFKNPDKIISHIPCYKTIQFIDEIEAKEKIAVLHQSDVNAAKKSPLYLKQLEKSFSRIYTRSKPIYTFFSELKLDNLKNKVIYSGVPIRTKKIENKQVISNKMKILYVGKLIKRKNLDLIIKALSEINIEKDFEFYIIGKGKEYKNILKLIKKLNMQDKVSIISELPREEVLKYMEKTDVFIMPSINETLGLVYLEAMSKGCITIGTKGEGIDGIIKNNENGFLIKPSVDEIKRVLIKILNFTSDEIKEYSENAINTALEFEESKMGKQYYKIITK